MFENMTWPNPDDPLDIEWAFRYGKPTQEQCMVAASFIAAYRQLICCTQKDRNDRVSQIRVGSRAARVFEQ